MSAAGTTIDTRGLDRILHIDNYEHTVTAEGGVRIGQLLAALAGQGLELAGNFDETQRTVGGAIAAPCFGAGIGGRAAQFAASVTSLKAVTASGKVIRVDSSQKHLLSAFRLSYGMLGTILEATLSVHPISTFKATHRKIDTETFATVVERLAGGNIGLKFSLLPYLDRVYIDVRHFDNAPGNAANAAWKIKDWGESTVLPGVFKSLHRVVPIPAIRYRLVDKISTATHELTNNRYLSTGTNAAAGGRYGRRHGGGLLRSTWCFPANDFPVVVRAYAKFCREMFARTGYRCDMPATGFRTARDASALLSPSFDEPMIALQTESTQLDGWDDFVLDLSDFAESWGGTPVFNATQSIRDAYVGQTYDSRLEFFRKIRRQLDPENRLLNPYLARFFR